MGPLDVLPVTRYPNSSCVGFGAASASREYRIVSAVGLSVPDLS